MDAYELSMQRNSLIRKATSALIQKEANRPQNIQYILFLASPSHSGQALLFQVYVLQTVQRFPAQMLRKFNNMSHF
jgi:hypothetical protein